MCLSADDEYTGGGTYITKLDRTIRLQQGEMLIHLGDLEHSGAEITSGVRRILIAFLACEWEDEIRIVVLYHLCLFLYKCRLSLFIA